MKPTYIPSRRRFLNASSMLGAAAAFDPGTTGTGSPAPLNPTTIAAIIRRSPRVISRRIERQDAAFHAVSPKLLFLAKR
jgi:hypothetical protein